MVRLLLLLTVSFGLTANTFGQALRKIESIKEVYRLYPERVDTLLNSIDLDRDGLHKVKGALKKKDVVRHVKSLCHILKQQRPRST